LIIVELLKKALVELSKLIVAGGCAISLRHLVDDAGHDIFSEFGFAVLTLSLVEEFE
jgi:hypothetical protein